LPQRPRGGEANGNSKILKKQGRVQTTREKNNKKDKDLKNRRKEKRTK